MKVCTECGESKDESEYYITRKGSAYRFCRVCQNAKVTLWREKNPDKVKEMNKKQNSKPIRKEKDKIRYSLLREEINFKKRLRNKLPENITKRNEYVDKTRDRINERKRVKYAENKELAKIYREKNKQYKAEYYKRNKQKIAKAVKLYRGENSNKIKEAKKAYNKSTVSNSKYISELPVVDSPRMDNGVLTVVCKQCNRRFSPTILQLRNRLMAINGGIGEANFYCSDACKGACPLFGFMTGRSVDPRSNLAVGKPKNTKIRGCATKSLKQLQCDSTGYNHCEKCGDIIDVDLHHTLPIAIYGDAAINSATHILLCFRCHTDAHASCA